MDLAVTIRKPNDRSNEIAILPVRQIPDHHSVGPSARTIHLYVVSPSVLPTSLPDTAQRSEHKVTANVQVVFVSLSAIPYEGYCVAENPPDFKRWCQRII